MTDLQQYLNAPLRCSTPPHRSVAAHPACPAPTHQREVTMAPTLPMTSRPTHPTLGATMKASTFAVLLGACALIAGFVLLALPVSASADGVNATCGSIMQPFTASAQQAGQFADENAPFPALSSVERDLTTECSSSIGTREAWMWVMFALGAVLIVGVAVVRRRET